MQDNNVQKSSVTLVPEVGSAYGNGWRQLWKYFLELFLIGIISILIGIPAGMGGWSQGAVAGFLVFLDLYTVSLSSDRWIMASRLPT